MVYLLLKTSLKAHVFLCETKDHLPRKVTPIFKSFNEIILSHFLLILRHMSMDGNHNQFTG